MCCSPDARLSSGSDTSFEHTNTTGRPHANEILRGAMAARTLPIPIGRLQATALADASDDQQHGFLLASVYQEPFLAYEHLLAAKHARSANSISEESPKRD